MLNAMRFGRLNEQTARAFWGLSREVRYDDGIEPTELYPTRAQVESANSSRLRKLPGVNQVFHARDIADLVVPISLPLKVGAQVMLVKNIVQGVLVNGSVGRVVNFLKPIEAMRMGIQLALPDRRDCNSPDVPDIGEGAVVEVPLTKSEKAAAQQREENIKRILQLNSIYPVVLFQSGATQLCVPLSFEANSAEGTVEAVRHQTLERVRVDLGRIFEKGQGTRIHSSVLCAMLS
ncbi:hypothetical protein BC628DRAFT_106512 [Trametes gibbosa]|nr:hypothetical protein BC628DRAFT_106512 [Trametes gibbosa]